MTYKDIVILIDDSRRYESELAKRGAELRNLFLAMRPGIPGVRHQLINRYLF